MFIYTSRGPDSPLLVRVARSQLEPMMQATLGYSSPIVIFQTKSP